MDVNIASGATLMDSKGWMSTDAFINGDGYLAMILHDGYVKGIYASTDSGVILRNRYYDSAMGIHQVQQVDLPLNSTFTVDGKTVYYTTSDGTALQGGVYTSVTPNNDVELLNYDPKYIAWTMIHGDISGGTTNTITVKWSRPTDQKVLTDTFNVDVTASSSDNNSSSGNESGSDNDQGGESGGGGSHGF